MKILIYVSSHSNSKPAVMFGGLIARATNSTVKLFTVVDGTGNLDAAHHVLEKAASWIPDLEVHTSARVGSAVSCILEEINSEEYDLIILKSRQAVHIKNFLATRISREIAQQAPISVLIIKRKRPEIKRILICTSGLDVADPVIKTGALLAGSTRAKVTLLHVTNYVPSMYTGLEKVDEHLSDLLQTDTPISQHLRQSALFLAEEGVDAQIKLRHGPVTDEILTETQTGAYDLIVIGASQASSNLKGWLLGDVALQIVNQARLPVLIVRS